MSRFIKTTSGYINQDHILLIRFGVTKEEEGHDLIQMSDGRIVQTQIQDFEWLAPSLRSDARAAHGQLDPEVRLEAEALHRPEDVADEPEPKYDDAGGDLGFGEARPEDPKPKYDEEAAKPA
jgi:hypothetical protein